MSFCLCTGAVLQCPFGSAPAAFSALPAPRVVINGRPAGVMTDTAPTVNIPPFGMCSSLSNPTVASATSAAMGVLTPMPCVPVPAGPWLKTGLFALLFTFAVPVFNSLCGQLIEDMRGPRFWEYFSVGDMLARRSAGDVSWVNPLIFQIMLVCSITLSAIGLAVELRRRRQA